MKKYPKPPAESLSYVWKGVPVPSTMANSGTDRNRFAVVKSGMMGGGLLSDDAADADCAVDAVIAANGDAVRRAVCKMLLRLSDENNTEEEVAVVSSP